MADRVQACPNCAAHETAAPAMAIADSGNPQAQPDIVLPTTPPK
jgi:hypothetical protein